ncbi:MAG: SpoIIE family protein phosphatase [Deltaproteobacteria bacterium]|nr:SpoIIE family protein phosphatase [Deltaproteobacteria bacterium]
METTFLEFRVSNEFLNLLLDNINVAVLIADENLRIYHVNNSFVQLFGTGQEQILERRFGGVTGCKYRVEEGRDCGETSYCAECQLRHSLLKTMVSKVPVDKEKMQRIFYIDGKPVSKFLEISTRPITYRGRDMILIILYDVTETEEQKIRLQQQQKQIEEDLEAAAEIQRTLLPQQPFSCHGVEIAWEFEPCSRVGGDIFNICCPQENRLDFYMLDVCGHGVAAALIAVSVSQFLRSRREFSGDLPSLFSPNTVLHSLNQAFPFERFDSYFTIIYGSVDLNRGILKYSCAGHPPPLILQPDGTLEVLDRGGPAIGIFSDEFFHQEEKKLVPGHKIVLYTDGVSEAFNTAGEMFGKHRFYQALRKYAHQSPASFVEAVYQTIRDFRTTAALEDDISLLVIEYVGNSLLSG